MRYHNPMLGADDPSWYDCGIRVLTGLMLVLAGAVGALLAMWLRFGGAS
jgi:hypothetical protein